MIDMELLSDVTLFKHKIWAFEYADRMSKCLDGQLSAPIRIDAELSTRCNLNCGMCARRGSYYESMDKYERERTELGAKKWISLAEESGKLGVKAWNISGLCEPMMEKSVAIPTMRMVKAYDMFGELTTNGTLWDAKTVNDCIEMGWDSVCISLDSAKEDVHDELRGARGTYKRVMNLLSILQKSKRKNKVSLPVTTLNVVLSKRNCDDLERIIKVAADKSVNAIFVEPMVAFNAQSKNMKMDDSDISKLRDSAKNLEKLAKSNGIVLDLTPVSPHIERVEREDSEPLNQKVIKKFDGALIDNAGAMKKILTDEAKKSTDGVMSIPCYYPWFNLMIRGNGTVTHCGEWKGLECDIENKTIEEIWTGKRMDEIRENMLKGNLPEFCEKCRPNIVEDTRIVRKSIVEFNDIEFLRNKYIEFLDENKRLKQKILSANNCGTPTSAACASCRYKRDMEKFRNSITYKTFSKMWGSGLEKGIKRALRQRD
jgi:MoaA/NifB/PqqE/SkfB family radical SAM enzyme